MWLVNGVKFFPLSYKNLFDNVIRKMFLSLADMDNEHEGEGWKGGRVRSITELRIIAFPKK